MDDAAPIRTVRCFTSVDEDTDDMVDGLLCGMCYIYIWMDMLDVDGCQRCVSVLIGTLLEHATPGGSAKKMKKNAER